MSNVFVKIYRLFTEPNVRFYVRESLGIYKNVSDEVFLKKKFKIRLGYELDLDNPKTFNEKMQWLKIYDRKPVYTTMVDKYEVKKYVGERIGYQHVIPTFGVWDKYKEIDFDKLPSRFVLKTTHDSGGLIIVRDKAKLNHRLAKRKIEKALNRQYFYEGREWPYKNVKPRIIAEEYIEDDTSSSLVVYKIFCFAGKPELVQVIQDDKTEHESIDYFDIHWNYLDLRQNYPNSKDHLKEPNGFKEMLEYAAKLSASNAFLRVDFYSVDSNVYFSEFTFYSDSGFAPFDPIEWDQKLGKLIVLSDDFDNLTERDDSPSKERMA